MPLYTKLQFGKLVNISPGNLSNYISRGKIICHGELIEADVEPNKSFIGKRISKSQAKPAKQKINGSSQTLTEFNPGKRNSNAEPDGYSLSLSDQLKNRKLEITNKLLEQKIEKILGETIPFDLISQAGASAFRNAAIQFRDAMEKRLTRWGSKFTTRELVDERKATLETLNEAIRNSITEYKKGLAEIVIISSNKKDVGEHE